MSSPSPPPPDIVATGGKFLRNRLMTPTILSFFDPYFYERLYHDLRLLQDRQEIREDLYGKDLASESRLAHTPPSVRDRFQSDSDDSLRRWMAVLTPATPSTSDNTPALLGPGSASPPPPDVVATRGEFLKRRPMTPTVLSFFDPYFYKRLCHDLQLLQDKQEIRERIYGKDLASESRLAHTPPSVRDRFQSDRDNSIRRWMAILTPATPNTSDNTPALLSPGSASPNRDASPTSPATPPASHEDLSSTAKPGLKRKQMSDEGDKEIALAPLKRMKPLASRGPLRRSLRLLEKNGRG